MVHVPTDSNVTVDPATAQVDVVGEVKATGRPDVAVAPTVKDDALSDLLASAAKLMTWISGVTWGVISCDCEVYPEAIGGQTGGASVCCHSPKNAFGEAGAAARCVEALHLPITERSESGAVRASLRVVTALLTVTATPAVGRPRPARFTTPDVGGMDAALATRNNRMPGRLVTSSPASSVYLQCATNST
jgi:hypothetical protein